MSIVKQFLYSKKASIVDWAEMPLAGFVKENRFKQFLFDVGMLGSISGMMPVQILQFEFGTYKGFYAKNYVAQELRAAGVEVLHCSEGKTSEIEFLLETDLGIIPLVVKSGRITQSKSLKVIEERYKPRSSVVLSTNSILILFASISANSRLYVWFRLRRFRFYMKNQFCFEQKNLYIILSINSA